MSGFDPRKHDNARWPASQQVAETISSRSKQLFAVAVAELSKRGYEDDGDEARFVIFDEDIPIFPFNLGEVDGIKLRTISDNDAPMRPTKPTYVEALVQLYRGQSPFAFADDMDDSYTPNYRLFVLPGETPPILVADTRDLFIPPQFEKYLADVSVGIELPPHQLDETTSQQVINMLNDPRLEDHIDYEEMPNIFPQPQRQE